MATERAMSAAARSRLCQRKRVWDNGITPVTASSGAGITERVACSWAADDDSPSAQTLPRPR